MQVEESVFCHTQIASQEYENTKSTAYRQTNMCGEHTNGYGRDNSFGKTTVEIQTVVTFLDAGRDFGDETENGTEDIWWILEGRDYPRLWWEATPDDVTDVKA